MTTVRIGLAVIGSLLMLLIGSVGYSFTRLSGVVDVVRKRTHRLANFYNVVAGKLNLPLFTDGD